MKMRTQKYVTQIGIGFNWIDMTYHDIYWEAQKEAISLKDENKKVRIVRRSEEVISEVLDKK